MKHIKKYNESSTEFKYPTSMVEVEYICKKLELSNKYTINKDYSIDVQGDCELANNYYIKMIGRLPIKFNKVSRDFDAHSCNLNTLEGCPRIVGRYFNVRDNKLKNLDYFPDEVNGLNAGILVIQNKISMIDPELLNKYGNDLIFSDNPISTLLRFLNKEGFKQSDKELLERLIEFDVLKGSDIDQINLERMYNFYELPFGLKIPGYNII